MPRSFSLLYEETDIDRKISKPSEDLMCSSDSREVVDLDDVTTHFTRHSAVHEPVYIEADEAFRFELDKFLCGIATASNASPLGRPLLELCRTSERRGYETGYLDRETMIPAEVHGLRNQRMRIGPTKMRRASLGEGTRTRS